MVTSVLKHPSLMYATSEVRFCLQGYIKGMLLRQAVDYWETYKKQLHTSATIWKVLRSLYSLLTCISRSNRMVLKQGSNLGCFIDCSVECDSCTPLMVTTSQVAVSWQQQTWCKCRSCLCSNASTVVSPWCNSGISMPACNVVFGFDLGYIVPRFRHESMVSSNFCKLQLVRYPN